MKENFDLAMEKQIAALDGKKRLLLHACCAPCTAGCVDRLTPFFDVTLYFYNPNIDGEEYYKRAEELKRFARCYLPGTEVIIEDHDSEAFYAVAEGLEEAPERGARCEKCYRLRLEKTARYAAANRFDFFATTLTLSPLKNAQVLNELGMEAEKAYNVQYLRSDFKKRGGNVRSKELSEEFELYRQDYCGCRFSKKQTASK